MKIIWTDEAEETLSNIILYLASKFSEQVAYKFYNECYKILDQIKREPFLFKKTEIESVRFFDTRQNPNRLSFNP